MLLKRALFLLSAALALAILHLIYKIQTPGNYPEENIQRELNCLAYAANPFTLKIVK